MKDPRRDAREPLSQYPRDDNLSEEDTIENCWGDTLNEGIKSFWESIDEEEIE